ncbi:hypothetical protein DFR48_103366 [Ciceribacter lividus]|uniref:PAS domain-containing protein n=2 Tax=Ciceribacter lividus TaxID=1197950 RepID=A0A6I7HNZ5_9HYPH|nr:hypothetical protein DFR48_103366 [Ciceribacter lividus]
MQHLPTDDDDADGLSRFTVSESWTGDLANGIIRLGECATLLHGLDGPECGLLNMTRCYDPHDRALVLDLFEQAATASSTFCYSTTIVSGREYRQPVFCIAETTGLDGGAAGSICGVFMFPRFRLRPALEASIYA